MKFSPQQLTRFYQILERLNRWGGKPVPKAELMALCQVSERTLKDDFAILREEKNVKIIYNRKEKGYELEEKSDFIGMDTVITDTEISMLKLLTEGLNQFKHLKEFYNLKGVIEKLENVVHFKINKTNEADFIDFESVPYFKGSELIPFFLSAIQKQQVVGFDYEKFTGEPAKPRILHPHLLKEHKNRWYIIGSEVENGKNKGTRIFGLDRIKNEQVIRKITYEPAPFDIKEKLKQSFGIYIREEQQAEPIILSFTAERGKYFQSQPFFPYSSADVLVDNDKELRICFLLIVNEELIMEIARLGKDVKVISPSHLEKEVKKYLKKALDRYTNNT